MANVKGTTAAVKNAVSKKAEETKSVVAAVAEAVEEKVEEVKAEIQNAAAEKAEAEPETDEVQTAEAETVEEAVEENTNVDEEDEMLKEEKRTTRKTSGKGRAAAKKEARMEAKMEAKKAVAEPKVYIQFGAAESAVDAVVERIRADYVSQGHRVSSIKDLRVYLKPEDGAAYYVINEKVAGRVDLF